VVLKAGVAKAPDVIERELVALVRERIGPVAAFRRHQLALDDVRRLRDAGLQHHEAARRLALEGVLDAGRLPKTRSGKILRGTMKKIADGDAWTMPPTIEDPAVPPGGRGDRLTGPDRGVADRARDPLSRGPAPAARRRSRVAAFRLALTVGRLPKTRSGKILRGTMKKIADGDAWTRPTVRARRKAATGPMRSRTSATSSRSMTSGAFATRPAAWRRCWRPIRRSPNAR
jgi:hypothetical protein